MSIVTAGALGGIEGTLDRMARNMNGLPQALSQAITNANAWQQRAEMYRQSRDENLAILDKAIAALEKEEARSAQLKAKLGKWEAWGEKTLANLKEAQEQSEARRLKYNDTVEWGNRLLGYWKKEEEVTAQLRTELKAATDKRDEWEAWGKQTRDSLEQGIAQRDARIAQLEAELKAARGA